MEENCMELVDESIGHAFPMSQVFRCIKVGLLCVQDRPEDRPTMSSVALMLGSENALLPNPKRPGFIAQTGSFDLDTLTNQKSFTMNVMTVTVVDGR